MNRDEPDAANAGAVGADVVGDPLAGEREATVNQTPQELLRSLPGIVSIAFLYAKHGRRLQSSDGLFSLNRLPRITIMS